MHLDTEHGGILAVCANPCWAKALTFEKLTRDSVNRAVGLRQYGGGKGVNAARVLRNLGQPVTVASFFGGHNGQLLEQELRSMGCSVLGVHLEEELRICETVICLEDHSATELIEPSPAIPESGTSELLRMIAEACPRHSAVCICGSRSPGVPIDFYVGIAEAAKQAGIPLLVDDVKQIGAVLETGAVTMLKINAGELRLIVGQDGTVPQLGKVLFDSYPVQSLAITDGASRAWLMTRAGRCWRYTIPKAKQLVSAIGCGDCVAAVTTFRLAAQPDDDALAGYYAEALGCATASCMTDVPSLFNPEDVVLPEYAEETIP